MASSLAHVRIFYYKSMPLKELAGYRKGQKLPDSANPSWNAMVGTMGQADLDQDLQATLDLLRANFKFKRRELEVVGPADGQASLMMPPFSYQSAIELDEERLTHAKWKREVFGINEPDKLLTPEFDQCFGMANWTLQVPASSPLNIEAVIDNIEDAENDAIAIDYDKDFTRCDVKIEGVIGSLRVTRDAFLLSPPSSIKPRQIFETLLQMRTRLAEIRDFEQFQ